MESKTVIFIFYNLLTDESTDTTDMAQLTIFIRVIDNKCEEMASLVLFEDTAKSLDSYEAVKNCINVIYFLTFVNVSGMLLMVSSVVVGFF